MKGYLKVTPTLLFKPAAATMAEDQSVTARSQHAITSSMPLRSKEVKFKSYSAVSQKENEYVLSAAHPHHVCIETQLRIYFSFCSAKLDVIDIVRALLDESVRLETKGLRSRAQHDQVRITIPATLTYLPWQR